MRHHHGYFSDGKPMLRGQGLSLKSHQWSPKALIKLFDRYMKTEVQNILSQDRPLMKGAS